MTDRNQQPAHDNPNNNPDPPEGGNRLTRSTLQWFSLFGVLTLLLLSLLFMLFYDKDTLSIREKGWTTFSQAIQTNAMENIIIRDDGIVIGTLRGNPDSVTSESIKWQTRIPLSAMDGYGWKELNEMCDHSGTKLASESTSKPLLKLLAIITFCLIVLVLCCFLVIRQTRSNR